MNKLYISELKVDNLNGYGQLPAEKGQINDILHLTEDGFQWGPQFIQADRSNFGNNTDGSTRNILVCGASNMVSTCNENTIIGIGNVCSIPEAALPVDTPIVVNDSFVIPCNFDITQPKVLTISVVTMSKSLDVGDKKGSRSLGYIMSQCCNSKILPNNAPKLGTYSNSKFTLIDNIIVDITFDYKNYTIYVETDLAEIDSSVVYAIKLSQYDKNPISVGQSQLFEENYKGEKYNCQDNTVIGKHNEFYNGDTIILGSNNALRNHHSNVIGNGNINSGYENTIIGSGNAIANCDSVTCISNYNTVTSGYYSNLMEPVYIDLGKYPEDSDYVKSITLLATSSDHWSNEELGQIETEDRAYELRTNIPVIVTSTENNDTITVSCDANLIDNMLTPWGRNFEFYYGEDNNYSLSAQFLDDHNITIYNEIGGVKIQPTGCQIMLNEDDETKINMTFSVDNNTPFIQDSTIFISAYFLKPFLIKTNNTIIGGESNTIQRSTGINLINCENTIISDNRELTVINSRLLSDSAQNVFPDNVVSVNGLHNRGGVYSNVQTFTATVDSVIYTVDENIDTLIVNCNIINVPDTIITLTINDIGIAVGRVINFIFDVNSNIRIKFESDYPGSRFRYKILNSSLFLLSEENQLYLQDPSISNVFKFIKTNSTTWFIDNFGAFSNNWPPVPVIPES